MEFTVSGTTVRFDERTMQFAFTRDGAEWNTCADFKPTLQCAQGTFAFADATSITHEQRETGTGTGIRSIFTGFGHSAYSFETYVWVERASGDVLFEWIPLNEQGLNITNVTWPAAMDFDCADDHDTTLITHEQGVMIPQHMAYRREHQRHRLRRPLRNGWRLHAVVRAAPRRRTRVYRHLRNSMECRLRHRPSQRWPVHPYQYLV